MKLCTDELWEILFALEDKLEIVEMNELKDSEDILSGKKKCLSRLIQKFENELNKEGA